MGNILCTNDKNVIDRIIFEGYLVKVSTQLKIKKSDTRLIKRILWSLSNMLGDTDIYIPPFYKEDDLHHSVL